MQSQRCRGRLRVLCTLLLAANAVTPPEIAAGWPRSTPSSNAQRLAACVDKLEAHIDQYGSVVPKQPDVWGQARMQKYRRMVEEVLEPYKGNFTETINATISRSDQASFENALALQAAISGPQAIVTRRGGSTIVNNSASPTARPTTTVSSSSSTTTANSTADESGNAPAPISIPDLTKSDFLGDNLKFIETKTSKQEFIGFKGNSNGVALEPTVMLDQLTTYLNHLNQIRRTNEGDDTADAPGYALHLVRIPVSVLPGKKTRQGYGAEITITAEPVISDNLLPTVFRSLISNDVADLAAAVMFDFEVNPLTVDAKAGKTVSLEAKVDAFKARRVGGKRHYLGMRSSSVASAAGTKDPTRTAEDVFSDEMFVAFEGLSKSNAQGFKPELILDLKKVADRQVEAAYSLLNAPGNEQLWTHASTTLLLAIRNCNQGDSDNACPSLPSPSKPLTACSVASLRKEFVIAIAECSGGSLTESDPVVAMAWAIIHASTLLNQQLLDDMANVAESRGEGVHPGGQMHEFFVPNPLPHTRGLFAQYVRARWPIHVFAIDPMTSDQNVADSYSRRRDMQLALSLAFTSGQMSAQNFTRYARRLELDMETIALNRTQVGFSHGNDTFGWRFYPRVQSPPTDGNVKVLFRDLLIGGPSRNKELNSMMLEPGARECVALVIMPSFVPYVRFDTRTNWFKLCNPKQKEFDLQTTVQLGTDVTCLREYSQCCQGDANVRGTDLALLMRSVDQLERRLPLQTCLSQVPFDLTLSGHQLFNHGTTSLGPRLKGYYGEPGAKGQDISVAVLGSNFSVSDTQVITGNVLLPAERVKMLSREVLVLSIPGTALADDNKIDVHVATPYGISNHLDIKLPVPPKDPVPSVWTVKPQSATCTYVVDDSKKPDEPGHFKCVSYTPAVVAQFSGKMTTVPVETKVYFEFDDIGPFVAAAKKRQDTDYFIIDVKGLAQQLLDALAKDGVRIIDDNSPPESNTYSLAPISIKVDGENAKIDGGFVITFKPKPQTAKKQ